MFSTSGNKGFTITFANGNKISVQWGPMNYCEPTHPKGRNAASDEPMKNDFWGAETVEVAAWDKDGNWHNFGSDQVIGWQTPEQVLEFMNFVANNELDTSDVSYMADDDFVENFTSTRGYPSSSQAANKIDEAAKKVNEISQTFQNLTEKMQANHREQMQALTGFLPDS